MGIPRAPTSCSRLADKASHQYRYPVVRFLSLNGFELSKIIFYFYLSNQFWPITFDRVPVAIVTVLSWHLTKDGIWINPKHGGTAYSQRSEHTSGVPMLFFIIDDPITT